MLQTAATFNSVQAVCTLNTVVYLWALCILTVVTVPVGR